MDRVRCDGDRDDALEEYGGGGGVLVAVDVLPKLLGIEKVEDASDD